MAPHFVLWSMALLNEGMIIMMELLINCRDVWEVALKSLTILF